MKVFDLGLKKYGDEPDYACAYLDFLTHLNGEMLLCFNTFILLEVRLRLQPWGRGFPLS